MSRKRSDEFVVCASPLSAPVHRPSKLEDSSEACDGEMRTLLNHRRDLTKDRKIVQLWTSQRKPLEEGKDPCFELLWSCHLEVVDTVASASHCAGPKGTPQHAGLL